MVSALTRRAVLRAREDLEPGLKDWTSDLDKREVEDRLAAGGARVLHDPDACFPMAVDENRFDGFIQAPRPFPWTNSS